MAGRFSDALELLARLRARDPVPSGRAWWPRTRSTLVAIHAQKHLRRLAHEHTFKGSWAEIRDHGPSGDATIWGAQAHTALNAFLLQNQGVEPTWPTVLLALFGVRKEPSPAELDELYVTPMLAWLIGLVEDEMNRSTTRIEFDTQMLTPPWESIVREEVLAIAPTAIDVESTRHPLGGLRVRVDLPDRTWSKADSEQLSFRVRQRLTAAWKAEQSAIITPILQAAAQPVAADPSPSENHKAKPDRIRVFISHAHEDRDIVGALVEYLKGTLNIPAEPNTIRFTSDAEHGFRSGDSASTRMRDESVDCDYFIAFISEFSVKASWVLFEMGARWGAKKTLALVLHPHADFAILPGFTKDLHATSLSDAMEMAKLSDDVGDRANYERRRGPALVKASERLSTFISGMPRDVATTTVMKPANKDAATIARQRRVARTARVREIVWEQVEEEAEYTAKNAGSLDETGEPVQIAPLVIGALLAKAREVSSQPDSARPSDDWQRHLSLLAREYETFARDEFRAALISETAKLLQDAYERGKSSSAAFVSQHGLLHDVMEEVYGYRMFAVCTQIMEASPASGKFSNFVKEVVALRQFAPGAD